MPGDKRKREMNPGAGGQAAVPCLVSKKSGAFQIISCFTGVLQRLSEMAQILEINPYNPQRRLIDQVVEVLKKAG